MTVCYFEMNTVLPAIQEFILIAKKIQQFTQLKKSLADHIVEPMHLNDKTVNTVDDIPCTKLLPLEEFGSPVNREFSYPSVVGQINYLQGHS